MRKRRCSAGAWGVDAWAGGLGRPSVAGRRQPPVRFDTAAVSPERGDRMPPAAWLGSPAIRSDGRFLSPLRGLKDGLYVIPMADALGY